MDLLTLFKLSHQKNAVRSYVWMRRLAYFSLMGTLRIACELMAAPSWRLSRLAMLLSGGAAGWLARPRGLRRDPSTETALGEVCCLVGLPLFFLSHGLALFMIGLGAVKAFLGVKALAGYLDALCSYLLKTEKRHTRRYFEGLSGTLDAGLGVAVFSLYPRMNLAVFCLLAAFWAAYRFPLSVLHLNRLPNPGQIPSPAIAKQLTPYVTSKRKRRRLIFMIRQLVRVLIPGRVLGAQNMPPETQKGVIYLCNHGYVQGTILSRAWFARPFRSWSLSDLMVPEDAYPHIRKYQVDTVGAFIPIRFRSAVTKVLVKFYAWLFDSLDSIPVYRNRLRQLMETFRETADALECGDLVVIYPENPDDPSLEKPGYLTDNIGPFFTGFTMIGSLYHSRTGESVTYVPMYCSKKKRRLAIGAPIVSDPERTAAEEKERIVSQAREAMLNLMAEVEGAEVGVSVV